MIGWGTILTFLFGKPLEAVLDHSIKRKQADLDHKRELLKSANEAEKTRLNHEIQVLEIEVRALGEQVPLAQDAWRIPAFRFFAIMLVASVMTYWTLRFVSASLNLAADFNIVIASLSTQEAAVSSLVIGFVFAAMTRGK
jgi:hypothetical protein